MKTQPTMAGNRYTIGINLMTNEELLREYESVQSLAVNSYRGRDYHIGQPHNWFAKQLSCKDLLVSRGLWTINNN